MRVFTTLEIKKIFAALLLILLFYIAAGQVLVSLISSEYKSEMITHDYEVAGYLLSHVAGQESITEAFTAEKTADDRASGQALLQVAGYNASVDNALLFEVKRFHEKFAGGTLAFSLAFSLAILAVFYIFQVKQNRRLDTARAAVIDFMNGNRAVRLDDKYEGSLSRFFSSVNLMATSLDAHISKEKHHKEFLKETISDISHQLKTPLTALHMYNEIIHDENPGNEVVDCFTGKSALELQRMDNLIQNLLKLARLDAGVIELHKQPHCLNGFLQGVLDRFQIRAAAEGKLLNLSCSGDTVLNCDGEWLSEAVGNIVKNALEHTKAGGTVNIVCEERQLMTRISIKDNGSGIHPEDLPFVFTRFYRSRFSKEKQGIGIGLALSRAIVEQHGGSIVVESKAGLGTAFRLVFPRLTNL